MIPEGPPIVVVPGCGRGYDVAVLASPHRIAIGLDIVQVEAASEFPPMEIELK
jgi:hypothetical protein